MSGNKAGSAKAVKTIKERYGDDFFARTGAKGGAKSRGGGFAANHDRARLAGANGGKRSKKGYKLLKVESDHLVYRRLADNKIVEFVRED